MKNQTDSTPNSYVPGEVELDANLQSLIDRRAEAMGSAYRLSYGNPIHVVRGEGVWLYDEEGNPYLDFYNNVVSLGHCHPRVVDAMQKQAKTLCTNTRYVNDKPIEYAERLTALFPDHLSTAMFTCTGSEANDLACRIAKYHTGGDGFIITEFAYHGTTDLISGMSANLGPQMPLHRNVRTVPAPLPQRGGSASEIGKRFTIAVEHAIADLKRHGIKPAALLVDTLFSSDGLCPDPPGFLKGAVDAIHRANGLFIADEVQPGFARTGDAMWGFDRHGVAPDIVTMGKPMGNGYPIAGIVLRPELLDWFGRNSRYFNTSAGNTVAAATGLAVLEVIDEEKLLSNSRNMGAYLKACLNEIKHDSILEVRGAGLFVGVEIGTEGKPDGQKARQLINGLREKRVLISATGRNENVLKLRPPLVAERSHIEHFIAAFHDVLELVDK